MRSLLSRLWRRRSIDPVALSRLPDLSPGYDMESALHHRRALCGVNHDRTARGALTKQHEAYRRDPLLSGSTEARNA